VKEEARLRAQKRTQWICFFVLKVAAADAAVVIIGVDCCLRRGRSPRSLPLVFLKWGLVNRDENK